MRSARSCCWPSRTWGARPARRSAPSSTISSGAGCVSRTFLVVDGGTGLQQALAALWGDVPTQRCTVHKHRNLLAHAPQRRHEEVSADYTDMIYAASPAEIAARRQAFIRKWRLKCKAVADSLEEAGDRLFTFTHCRPANGRARAPPTRSNGSMRNSSAGSRPRRCCLRPKPQPCCSGHCSPPVRSQCAKSTAGRPSTRNSPTSRLTSLPDPLSSSHRRPLVKFLHRSRQHRDKRPADKRGHRTALPLPTPLRTLRRRLVPLPLSGLLSLAEAARTIADDTGEDHQRIKAALVEAGLAEAIIATGCLHLSAHPNPVRYFAHPVLGERQEIPTQAWGEPIDWRRSRIGRYDLVRLDRIEIRQWIANAGQESQTQPAGENLPRASGATSREPGVGSRESGAIISLHTGLPGRPTSWHLIEAECRRRYQAGERHDTKAEWARQLRAWIVSQHPGTSPPTKKTIANRLTDLLRELPSSPKC